jgi:signal transduction histidine kinase
VFARFSEEDFSLTVEDNGSGFESGKETSTEGHFGLVGIQERIRRLGGSVRVMSVVAKGTNVSMRVPRAAVCVETKRQAEAAAEEMVR